MVQAQNLRFLSYINKIFTGLTISLSTRKRKSLRNLWTERQCRWAVATKFEVRKAFNRRQKLIKTCEGNTFDVFSTSSVYSIWVHCFVMFGHNTAPPPLLFIGRFTFRKMVTIIMINKVPRNPIKLLDGCSCTILLLQRKNDRKTKLDWDSRAKVEHQVIML